MVKVGHWNNLMILRRTLHGVILDAENLGDVLLPKKWVPDDLDVSDRLNVFIFFDSEDRLTATTQKVKGIEGSFSLLNLKSSEDVGCFFDWGLDKDLFMPHAEKVGQPVPGRHYLVRIYLDSSGRIAASMKVSKFLTKPDPKKYTDGKAVNIIPYTETDLGWKVIVDDQFDGLLYHSEVFEKIKIGEQKSAFIKKCRDDLKLDIILRNNSPDSIDDIASLILDRLSRGSGRIYLTDKSSSEQISSEFGISRKKFKLALAGLYSKRIVAVFEDHIELVKKIK